MFLGDGKTLRVKIRKMILEILPWKREETKDEKSTGEAKEEVEEEEERGEEEGGR